MLLSEQRDYECNGGDHDPDLGRPVSARHCSALEATARDTQVRKACPRGIGAEGCGACCWTRHRVGAVRMALARSD